MDLAAAIEGVVREILALEAEHAPQPTRQGDLGPWAARLLHPGAEGSGASFGLDVGLVEGWVTAALTRLRGAGWLTLLGSPFAQALEEAGRLSLPEGITVTRARHGLVLQAGAEPTLGDVARGEFPTLLAAVERAILPLKILGHHEAEWLHLDGSFFELPPFAAHHATGAFIGRLVDPQGFLVLPAERVEALLARLEAAPEAISTEDWTALVQACSALTAISNALAVRLARLIGAQRQHGRGELLLASLSALRPRRVNLPVILVALNNTLGALHKEDLEAAERLSDAVQALAPRHPTIYLWTATIYLERDRLGDAAQQIALAMDHAPAVDGPPTVERVRNDPDFAPLLTHPKVVAAFERRAQAGA